MRVRKPPKRRVVKAKRNPRVKGAIVVVTFIAGTAVIYLISTDELPVNANTAAILAATLVPLLFE